MDFTEKAPGVFFKAGGEEPPAELVAYLADGVANYWGGEPIYMGDAGTAQVTKFGGPGKVTTVEQMEAWSVVDPETGVNETMDYAIIGENGWEIV